MKKLILVLFSIFLAQSAFADTCATKLMPLFVPEQARKLCVSFGSAINGDLIPAANNTYDIGKPVPLRWRSLYLAGDINLNAASTKIFPGATSIVFRNNADSANNLTIADSGTITLGRASDLVFNVGLGTIALQESTAGTACSGTLTANGATPVVTATTCATTGSRIFTSRTSAETGTVNAWVSAISNGVSFSVTSEAADTGTYNWIIFHESP